MITLILNGSPRIMGDTAQLIKNITDNILIASPIYFSELTGKLLDVGSRLQTQESIVF